MLALRAKADRGLDPSIRTDSPKFSFFRYIKKAYHGEVERTKFGEAFASNRQDMRRALVKRNRRFVKLSGK
uniref:Uncharacterized protein n=1 Tax=Candidatus Kentrum sp. TUN TaxID=2126343 RepID=A0A451A9J2_9GAMM|nr:MAG: hypothetical protein BECKTUN1418E_GA0071001_100221 [Candidatus Kentron sp. TUN]VFK62703.1 MAG: hypothetical protein BECKTUN1418D_GA0071000_11843 [Candidatus Kentron sp. TUN]